MRGLYYETSGAVDMRQFEFEEMKWPKIDETSYLCRTLISTES